MGLARGAAATLLAALPTICGAETFRFAHVYEVDSIYHEWALWAAEQIAERTEGRHAVEVFPASSLGKENELPEALAMGAIDMAYNGSLTIGDFHGPMAISSAPFMFRDLDHWRAYRESPLFAEIASGFEEATGHEVLGLAYYGARHATANQALPTPSSMEGIKMRVPNARVYLLFPESVGANATPIDFSEVYLALQQGVVDAQENPLPTILAKRFYEVQSHIMLTGHLMDSIVTIMAGPAWEGLSEEDRANFAEVYAEAAEGITDAVEEAEARLAQEFETEHGLTVIEVDRAPFREAMMPLLTGEDLPWTPELVERVNAIE